MTTVMLKDEMFIESKILADLISQGYGEKELFEKFTQIQKKIRPAVEAMFADADKVAESKSGGYSLENVLEQKIQHEKQTIPGSWLSLPGIFFLIL